MRYVYPLSIPPNAKVGDNLNKSLTGKFETTASAILQEDGSVWLEPEDLIKPDEKTKGKLNKFETHIDFII